MRRHLLTSTTAIVLLFGAGNAYAGMDEAKTFLDKEIGDLSSLPRADQEKEMQWFIDAAKPFAGMEIKVVSEAITTHQYESDVLAPAFTAITGIKVTHDIIQEGDVVEKIQTQMQTGQNLYDGWVNDSDLIGTHWRYQQVRNLTDFMANEGKDVTNPGLDLADFIGTSFTTAPDKKLYQLPDQQFANLYWFRYDWFNDEKNKADFNAKYGYDLGVPPYGLRQEGPVAWLAVHRRLAVHGRQWRQGHPERPAGRRMGHQGR
jgi:glycerol transport system substrate-binding protein